MHPGYGFLSESAEFVDMCEEAGIAFLGPKSDTMRLFSRKHDARAFAENAKVPILAGEHALDHQLVAYAPPSADCYLPSESVQHECTYLHFPFIGIPA